MTFYQFSLPDNTSLQKRSDFEIESA